MFSIDEDLRARMQSYTAVKQTLHQFQRKQTGNLSQKSLNDIVSKEDFVQDSEYLETLLIAVPKVQQKEWLKNYETMANFVVPRSSQKLAEDDEFVLFSVTLFKKFAGDFVHKCREYSFIPRTFTYDERQMDEDAKGFDEASSEERRLWVS